MMELLLTTSTAFGLSAGAGGRAGLPVLALGAFHYTPWFTLSSDMAWIADPVVMSIVGVLAAAEIWVEADPDLSEFADMVGWLPKIVAGFLAFAAATGTMDDGLMQFGASGLLGGATAGGVHLLRSKLRAPVREAADASHPTLWKAYSHGEVASTGAVTALAFLAPVLAPVALAGGLGLGWWVRGRILDRSTPCAACESPVRVGARICPDCGADQAAIPT